MNFLLGSSCGDQRPLGCRLYSTIHLNVADDERFDYLINTKISRCLNTRLGSWMAIYIPLSMDGESLDNWAAMIKGP